MGIFKLLSSYNFLEGEVINHENYEYNKETKTNETNYAWINHYSVIFRISKNIFDD